MNPILNKHNKALLFLLFFFAIPAFALELKPDPEPESKPETKLELSELLQLFSQQQQSTVDFNEEKYTSFLKKPIKSSGQLQFIAPNKLNKFITQPEQISQKITADKLEIKENNKTHIINLNEHPEFSVILRSIISLLSGNQAALKKDFKITFKDVASSWTLTLTPHDSYISGYVESITMFGSNDKLMKIIVTEPNKDHSITHIYNHR